MRLILTHEGTTYDLTEITGNVVLNTSMDTLGASLTFDLARNYYDINFATSEKISVGDVIVLSNEKELFKGIVLDITTTKFTKNIKCLDYCFYLNKNKILKQFEEISASNAINQLLQEVKAPIGTISSVATSISKMYNNNTVAEIINDILEQVNNELGTKYLIEFEDNKFNIIPFKKINVQFRYKKTTDESVTESILEMKNSVLVVSNEQDDAEILATAKDEENIEKYGRLQEIISVSPDEDEAKVRNIAKIKLKELNKIFKTVSIKGFGDDNFRAGRVITLDNIVLGLHGDYLIKSCSHTWVDNEHLVTLEVEQYAE
ncbi:hypothetical protein [Fusobacterium varium]|uniref:XkdQ/YqbQ family protein n=1 Tax=Fusobacterium varium TaxID=856 RepID=UPI0022E71DEC|nr:hypothetical protein [Fusobacterium varium]